MAGEDTQRLAGRRRILAGFLFLLGAGGGVLTRDAVRKGAAFLGTQGGAPLLALVWVAALAALAVLALGLLRWRRLGRKDVRPVAPGVAVRAGIYAGLLALGAGTAGHALGLSEDLLDLRNIFYATLLLTLSAWTAVLILRPTITVTAPRGALRLVDVGLMNLFVLLVVIEAGVGLYARWLPSRVLWSEESAQSRIEAFRADAGDRYFGFRFNRGGYHDDEFFAAGPDDFVAVALADSFGLGFVAHADNFLTVAEEALSAALGSRFQRVAVHNFGVASIGMSEYAWLLEHEAMELDPRLVVLCVYVGNDIAGLRPAPRRYYALQTFQAWQLARRLLTVAREAGAGRPVFEEPAAGGDVLQRPPPMREEAYREIALEHLAFLHARSRRIDERYQEFFAALDAIHARAGDRLLVVLIPDELQVDDALYDGLLELVEEPDAYVRDLPQRRILTHGRGVGIPMLDLLPDLREAHGSAPTYLPRDTHWNEHGNRVAGGAIAARVLRDLEGAGATAP